MTDQTLNGNDENLTPKGTEPENTGGESQTTPPNPTNGNEQPEVDYKKKFSESSAEALRLKKIADETAEENARLKAQLESNKPITEDELLQVNPDYEIMTESEKAIFKKQVADSRLLHKVAANQKWQEDYASIPSNLKQKINAKGGEFAFKAFATRPENIGMKDIIGLARLFVLDDEPKPTPEPTPAPASRPGLESGAGGSGQGNIKVRTKGQMTAAEAKNLRQTNPREYQDLAQSGRLEIID